MRIFAIPAGRTHPVSRRRMMRRQRVSLAMIGFDYRDKSQHFSATGGNTCAPNWSELKEEGKMGERGREARQACNAFAIRSLHHATHLRRESACKNGWGTQRKALSSWWDDVGKRRDRL